MKAGFKLVPKRGSAMTNRLVDCWTVGSAYELLSLSNLSATGGKNNNNNNNNRASF